MKNKLKFIYILFSISISHWSVGQTNPIVYIFGGSVQKALEDRVSFILSKEPNAKFYLILMMEVHDQEKLGNYVISVGNYVNNSDELPTLIDIIGGSNRYSQCLGIKIPIIFFDYDFPFISYGINSKGRIARKNIVGNFFSIEFTSAGKLIKKEDN